MKSIRGKHSIILVSFLIMILSVNANAIPSEEWNKTFGGTNFDYSTYVQQTADGGYVLSGYTESFGAGNGDLWLIKTDARGNELWNKTFGGTLYDYGGYVQQTADGGYILSGYTESFGAGSYDLWLIKTDESGNEQWNNTFGGTNYDEGGYVQQTGDGGYILSGSTESFGAGNGDLWLIKTDALGTEQWNKTFGGTNYDEGGYVQQTADGGYVLSGTTYSYGAGFNDIWLIKTDESGNEQWNKTFGGTSIEYSGYVQQTAYGEFVLSGITRSYGAGLNDIWLIKTDESGNEQWNRTFGGTSWEEGGYVQQTKDGGYILSGQTDSYGAGSYDLWLIKIDASGNEQWNKTFGGTSGEFIGYVQQTKDGGYILSGYTNSYGTAGDFWLIKLSGETSPDSIGYSATVATGQNTILESSDGSFGPLMKGETKTISNSVVLNNTGDLSAKVEARLNDSVSGVYGLVNGTNLLNASNFSLGPSGTLVPLLDNGDNVLVAIAPPGVTALDARLVVPSDAVAGDYTGTVILTFSNLI